MTTVKEEIQKFEGYVKTLELKLFKGKLHQKIVAPHIGQTPAHAWVPVAEHDEDAPAPGEIPAADQAAAEKAAAPTAPADTVKTDAELTDEEKALAAGNGEPQLETAPPGGLLDPTDASYAGEPLAAEPAAGGIAGDLQGVPVDLVQSGNAQAPADATAPVRYDDSGAIPAAPVTKAPQPAAVAAQKAPATAQPAKTAK